MGSKKSGAQPQPINGNKKSKTKNAKRIREDNKRERKNDYLTNLKYLLDII